MSTKQKLQVKAAVINGGNSGIGLATTKRFVAEGAYVQALPLMSAGSSIILNASITRRST